MNNSYCTYYDVFILEELALNETAIRGIDQVTLEIKDNK